MNPERRTASEEPKTDEIMAAFRQVAHSLGEADREEILRRVARELGYEGLRKPIRERLTSDLRVAIRRKIVAVCELVCPETPTMADYQRDELVGFLCSVMRKGTRYEREDVIRAVANHLGFRRLTDTVRTPVKSAINAAIRRGVIAYEGNLIWRL